MNQLMVSGKFFKDEDISYRTHLFIDVDPVTKDRPVKEEITKQCVILCKKINKELRKLGFPRPLVMKTGNGAALFYPLKSVKNSKKAKLLFTRLYKHLARYSNDDAKVDISVGNASRYGRLPGTHNCKDIGNGEEYFQRCKVISFPDKIENIDFGGLKKIVEQLPIVSEGTTDYGYREDSKSIKRRYALDVENYCDHYGIEILKTKRKGSSILSCLQECIFDRSHTPNDAAIVQQETGKLSYQCFHTSCIGKTWHDAKMKISGSDSLKKFFRGSHYDNDLLDPQYTDVKVLGLAEILNFQFEDKPLIRNLIDVDEMVMLYGPPGVEKSALTTYISLWGAHPLKHDMFGLFKFDRPFTTLFVQAENPAKQIKKRSTLQLKYCPEFNKGVNSIYYLSAGNTGRASGQFSNRTFQKILSNAIIETNADLLIVDPMVEFCKGVDENSNEAMIVELSCLKSLCEYTGTALIVVHHTGKDGRGYRGASSIGGWVDRVIKLGPMSKDGEECFKIIFEKTRNQEDMPPITIKKAGLKFERISDSKDDEMDIVVSALQDLGGTVEMQKDLVDKIGEVNSMTRTTARRKIEAAVAAGKIEYFKNGQSKGYKLIGSSGEDE